LASNARHEWKRFFGSEPDGDTVADALTWQLTDGSDPTGDTPCKSLLPTHLGVCEIHAPWHSVLRQWKFGEWNPDGNRYHNRVRDLLRADMAETIADCDRQRNELGKRIAELTKGKPDAAKQQQAARLTAIRDALADHPAKVLGGLALKYRCDAADITREVGPKKPTTAISDNFNRANETLTDGPWTISNGTWTVESNQARNATGGNDYAAHTTELSSADMWSQATNSGGNYSGNATRVKTTATSHCYTSHTDTVNRARLRRYSARTVTDISFDSGNYLGAVFWLESSGSTHTVKIGGTQKMKSTDTTITTPSYAGIFAYGSYADDFSAADLFAGSPLPLMDSFRGGFL